MGISGISSPLASPLSSPLRTGLAGIQKGIQQASKASSDIVSAASFSSGIDSSVEPVKQKDVGDLASSIVDLKTSTHLVRASAKIVEAADENIGTILDILA